MLLSVLLIFAAIGFIGIAIIILGFIEFDKPDEYTGGADGDWERYQDKCNGTYNERYDRPMTQKEIQQRDISK